MIGALPAPVKPPKWMKAKVADRASTAVALMRELSLQTNGRKALRDLGVWVDNDRGASVRIQMDMRRPRKCRRCRADLTDTYRNRQYCERSPIDGKSCRVMKHAPPVTMAEQWWAD